MGFFGSRRPWKVDVHLPIALQPSHRTDWYEEPLVAELQASALGSWSDSAGTQLGADEFVESCDIGIFVPREHGRDAAVRIVAEALDRIHAPHGSVVSSGRTTITVGSDTVLTVRLPLVSTRDFVDAINLPHNREFDRLRATLDDALRGLGQVRSWQVNARGTQFTVVTRTRQPAHDIVVDAVLSSGIGGGARGMENPRHEIPEHGRWGVPLIRTPAPGVDWRGPAVYYVRCDDGSLYAGSSQNLRRRLESLEITYRHQDRPIVRASMLTDDVATHADRRIKLQQLMNTLKEQGDFKT